VRYKVVAVVFKTIVAGSGLITAALSTFGFGGLAGLSTTGKSPDRTACLISLSAVPMLTYSFALFHTTLVRA